MLNENAHPETHYICDGLQNAVQTYDTVTLRYDLAQLVSET